MAAIICIANQKGGVGKTTSAVHLAAGFAAAGRRSLLVDLDAQGNASSIFLETPAPAERSALSIFKDRATVESLAWKTRLPGLELLPANVQLAETEALLAGAVDGFFRFSDALGAAREIYDRIVIDCPPNLGQLTVNAFVASTHLITPLQTAKFSLDGLRTILDSCAMVQKRLNPQLRILGALVTMYNPRTAIAQAILDPMAESVSIFATRISRSVAVEEAHLMQQTLYEYDPRSKPAQEYLAFTAEVESGIEKG
ncbi:MAG: ParA family protein [Leptospirales bacterium]|nr:ParA family protein [Leptospirales bacterium]